MTRAIKIRLGVKIKELRMKCGYTQERLAELADIDYKYLQRLEGKAPPAIRVDTLEKIAKALKTEPSELLKYQKTAPQKVSNFQDVIEKFFGRQK
jgi:transcriptional regulator with XRE-family HTH domain